MASNFIGRFVGVPGRESLIFVNLAPPEALNRTCYNMMLVGFCDSHAYQVCAARGRKIGMCG